jgi:hypothetical protein
MNALFRPLSKVLFDSDLILTRLLLALSEFFWAVLLLWPGPTFGRPTYTVMSKVMSEEMWGAVFLASALTQFVIVFTEKYHSVFARVFAAWNAFLWMFVVISMMASVYPPPAAISAEIVMALSAVWLWIRPYLLADIYREGLSRARQPV